MWKTRRLYETARFKIFDANFEKAFKELVGLMDEFIDQIMKLYQLVV